MSCHSERKHTEPELESVEELDMDALDIRLDDVELEQKKLAKRLSKVEAILATLQSSSSATRPMSSSIRSEQRLTMAQPTTLSEATPASIQTISTQPQQDLTTGINGLPNTRDIESWAHQSAQQSSHTFPSTILRSRTLTRPLQISLSSQASSPMPQPSLSISQKSPSQILSSSDPSPIASQSTQVSQEPSKNLQ